MPKTIGTHIPDDWEYQNDFDERLEKSYRGKPGPYLRDLIERDLSAPLPADKLTAQQIAQWLADERTLLAAADIATTVLATEDTGERDRAALALAQLVLNATRRKPMMENFQAHPQDKLVLDAKMAVKPKPHPEIHASRKSTRRAGEKSA